MIRIWLMLRHLAACISDAEVYCEVWLQDCGLLPMPPGDRL